MHLAPFIDRGWQHYVLQTSLLCCKRRSYFSHSPSAREQTVAKWSCGPLEMSNICWHRCYQTSPTGSHYWILGKFVQTRIKAFGGNRVIALPQKRTKGTQLKFKFLGCCPLIYVKYYRSEQHWVKRKIFCLWRLKFISRSVPCGICLCWCLKMLNLFLFLEKKLGSNEVTALIHLKQRVHVHTYFRKNFISFHDFLEVSFWSTIWFLEHHHCEVPFCYIMEGVFISW